jgi:CubicO group peptidase (beta-lactamase class C family)
VRPLDVSGKLPTLAARLDDALRERRLTACQAFASLDGEPLLDVAIAANGGAPITTESWFPWFCAVKPLVAVALAAAAAQRGISLHEPVADHLPAFGCHGKGAITPLDLLLHRSGLANPPPDLAYRSSYEQILAGAIAGRPEHAHGRAPTAYNFVLAWHVLAALAERWSGQRIDELCDALLFAPLRLTGGLTLSTHADHAIVARLAPPVVDLDGRRLVGRRCVRPAVCRERNPCSGGYGSMRDLARCYEELLRARAGRGRLLDPATVDILLDARTPVAPDATIRREVAYAAGFQLDMGRHLRAAGPQPDSFGASGAFAHERILTAFADPRHGLVLALAITGTTAPSRDTVGSLVEALYADLLST